LHSRCAGHLENCNDPNFRQFRFYAYYFNNYFGHGMANSAETASAWLTVLVSVERYMAMKYPMLALTYCRHSSGRMHVIIIILLSVAFNAPLFFTTRCSRKNVTTETGESKEILVTYYTAFGKSTDYDIFTWFRFVLVQIVPLIALCIFNSLLLTVVSESYRKLRTQQEVKEISHDGNREVPNSSKHQRTVKQLQIERRQRAQTKLTLMQICVIFLFLIGQIPQAFSFEKIANVIMPVWCGKCCKFRIYYQVISILLSQIGFSLPFFIYFSLNRHFRKILLTCCKSKPTEHCTTRYSRATIVESRVY
uniref:G_PROTEIN_RECEP_F1_2 domain-containing protein n=1 Tax=Rodentolepis nana TaxID=102285 RepID=A0A0R3T4A1_RODNA